MLQCMSTDDWFTHTDAHTFLSQQTATKTARKAQTQRTTKRSVLGERKPCRLASTVGSKTQTEPNVLPAATSQIATMRK